MVNNILILFLTISACQQKSGYQIDCEFAEKQAQNDFKYKNFIWTDFLGLEFDDFGRSEFVQLLQQKEIKHKTIGISCVVDGNQKFENCYERKMNQLLNSKFGKNFIDSLKTEARKMYVLKRKDSVFSFEYCDQTSRHPYTKDYNEQFSLSDEEFFKNFVYPSNYIKRLNDKDYYSYTEVYFILMKDGTCKNFEVQSYFQNTKNKIFENSFNQKVLDYVKSVKWNTATIEGIPVNSYMDVSITYE